MQTLERIIITKNLDFHLEGDEPEKVSLLLRAVKKALDEIKKEKPFLTELNISELSFLPGNSGEIMLKVCFE